MSGPTGFEKAVKEALEPYEVPYNSADWGHLERALDGRSDDVARVSRSGLYALLIGGSLAAVSSFLILTTPNVPAAGEPMSTSIAPTMMASNGTTDAKEVEVVSQETAPTVALTPVETPAKPEIKEKVTTVAEDNTIAASTATMKPTEPHSRMRL